MNSIDDVQTVDEAKAWLRKFLNTGGAECPVCERYAVVYRWSLYSTAVSALMLYYRLGGTTEFVASRELTRLGHKGKGDVTRLKFWGLVEPGRERREDGGRAGFYRVTDKGERFIRGEISLPKYVYEYSGQVLYYDGKSVDVKQALGKKFNYQEFVNRAPEVRAA